MFAVVSPLIENNRALATLRYYQPANSLQLLKPWHKLNSREADQLLRKKYPDYLYHSDFFDADLHGVSITSISQHYKPTDRVQQVIKTKEIHDPIIRKLQTLLKCFHTRNIDLHLVGITGSVLINAHSETSDLDLVIYDRDVFSRCREVFKELVLDGKCELLSPKDWLDAYERRGCEITLEAYIAHEKRKWNKVIIENTKVDLSFVDPKQEIEKVKFEKAGRVELSAKVISDDFIFDSPAIYPIEHPSYKEILSFTPTYAGQVFEGEQLFTAATIERNTVTGQERLVVGSNREAKGEYILSGELL